MTTTYMVREESSKIYIDADVIVALNDPDDKLRDKVVSVARRIARLNIFPVCGINILMESLTLVSQRLGIKVSNELLDDIFKDYEIVFIDKSVVNLANKFFKNRTSKNVGYSDCISFAIMKLNKIKKIFTFDEDFKKQGFELLR